MAIFMTSWQFPHFYGILWTYKDDFAKAGFKMITNVDKDGRLSSRSAKLGTLGMLASCTGMTYTGMLAPWAFALAVFYTYKPVIDSLNQFTAVKFT